jgi:dTDP-4-dehydrorhamnose reductase
LSHHNKKIFIIGSSGLVGSNLLSFCSRYSFLTIPTFHRYFPEEYRETGLNLDITNPQALRESLETVDPDCVVNLSCLGVAFCENDPERAYQVQVAGVRDLADACKEYNIRLIHLSTDMVYSGNKGTAYNLSDVPDPTSVYGKTKLDGEEAIQEIGGSYVIIRSALVLGRGRFRRGGFLDWMVERIAGGKELPLFTDQLRTPLVVDDLIDTIFALAEASFTGILLAGGDEGVNRVAIGEKLLHAMGVSCECIKPVVMDSLEHAVPLQRDLRLDSAKLKEVLHRGTFTGIGDYFKKEFGEDSDM